MEHQRTIEAYYRAFRERDLEGLRALLTPDFRHVSAFGAWRDRDAMLDAIWPHVGRVWAAGLEIYGVAPAFMVRYHHEGAPDAPCSAARLAEFIRFDGERIAEIEVYVGPETPPHA